MNQALYAHMNNKRKMKKKKKGCGKEHMAKHHIPFCPIHLFETQE
jgi:hypothetical protein